MVKRIVSAKIGDIPITRDSQFIQFEYDKPELPFITGNRIVFTKDNTTLCNVRNSRPEYVHNDQKVTMMQDLLILANAEEANRCNEAFIDLLRAGQPIVSALEDSRTKYIFHVNADVGFSRFWCCLTWIKNNKIFASMLIYFLIWLIGILVVLAISGVFCRVCAVFS